MFGNAKIKNSSVWKSQNSQFQCLEKPKIKNFIDWNRQNSYFQCLEMRKFRIPMFGKAKIHDSNVWRRKRLEFQ